MSEQRGDTRDEVLKLAESIHNAPARGGVVRISVENWLAIYNSLASVPSETREIEMLRIERDVAQARHERAMQFLTRIYAFLNPPFVTTQGKTYSFQNPDANETLQILSDAIRAIPEDLRSAPSAIGQKPVPISEATMPMLEALKAPCRHCGKRPIDTMDFS